MTPSGRRSGLHVERRHHVNDCEIDHCTGSLQERARGLLTKGFVLASLKKLGKPASLPGLYIHEKISPEFSF
jgi:hypothetical protein